MRKVGMIGVIFMIISGLVFTDVAFAGRVGKRQVHQQKRICQGVKSGELTGRETRRLEREHTFSTISTSSHVTFLVEKARGGSRTAFNELVDLFQKDIFRMVFYRTLSRMDAENLTQDIFIQAFKNLSRLKTPDWFRSWLFSISLNRIRDFHRKKRFMTLFGFSTGGGT